MWGNQIWMYERVLICEMKSIYYATGRQKVCVLKGCVVMIWEALQS